MLTLNRENQLLKYIIVNKLLPLLNTERRCPVTLHDLMKEENKRFIPALLLDKGEKLGV